ncbi:MAG: TIGR04282 family arsenosugar biosynthesis glycosyltransferase [Spirulinaceae cyanobacterium]
MINDKRLIIFSRYPEPGKTKTRMIPVLGAKGAAELQRKMTEATLAEAAKLLSNNATKVTVFFAGGNQQIMQEWLGTSWLYQPQAEGDLGARMHSAFQISFSEGNEKVVIIGIDCPDLNAQLLTEAFQLLSSNDLVLGPAEDGGYYLIGLRCLIPELLQHISWGTSQVFAQTTAIATKLNLATACLPILKDIDRPEDL